MTERKLSDDEVREIRKLYRKGKELRENMRNLNDIATEFGLTRQQCRRVYQGTKVRQAASLPLKRQQDLMREINQYYESQAEVEKYSVVSLSERFGVTTSSIHRIGTGSLYRSVVDEHIDEDYALQLAMELIPRNACTDNALSRKGVPKTGIFQLIRKAEAKYVNDAMALFPPPPQYEKTPHH